LAKETLKVLALVTDAFGAYGGIAQYNQDFLAAVADLDAVDRAYVLPRIWDGTQPENEANLRIFAPSMNKVTYSARSFWLSLKLKPDLIYCGHLYHGPLAARLAKVFSAKLISQLHGTEVWDRLPSSLLRPLEQSDQVLCVSNDTKRRYEQQFSSPPKNGRVVHNTVAKNFVLGDREFARAKFDVENNFALLSVGRLDARKEGYKGHDKVIDALPDLLQRRPDTVYLIAGIGDDHDRLVKRVNDRGVTNHVRFLGKVPAIDLPELYRAADLFVLPSTGEGFGIVFLEAMASGTMAMGLDVGGAGDALCHGELGICVEEEAFKPVLLEAVTSPPSDRARLSQRTIEKFGAHAFRREVHSTMSEIHSLVTENDAI